MGWFPTTRDTSNNGWRFDIVGLLAVIGESTISSHAQAITASSFSRFPRLIPAPQALLQTKRPSRLPSIPNIVVIGVHSGTYLDELNFFADIIHDVGALKDFEFRVYDIEYSKAAKEADGRISKPRSIFSTRKAKTKSDDPQLRRNQGDGGNDTSAKTQAKGPADATSQDVEKGSPGTTCTVEPREDKVVVKIPMSTFSPLNILTLTSILMTIGLVAWAAAIQDGVALVALASISVSASLACLSSGWYPELTRRTARVSVPPGDIVIKRRGAAFVVVHCSEEITRELYAGTEKCHYVIGEEWHRGLVATSTVLLMISVVLLGNCEWTMQAAIGVAYIVLNLLYWGIPLIAKQKSNWDMGRYEVRQRRHTRGGLKDAHLPYTTVNGKRAEPNFTRTLWYAIQETGEVRWVRAAHLAPKSDAWEKWLNEAKANCDNVNWDAVGFKDELMQAATADLARMSTQLAVPDQQACRASGSQTSVTKFNDAGLS